MEFDFQLARRMTSSAASPRSSGIHPTGSKQYVWKADGPNGYADPDGPPVGKAVPGGPQATYVLPKSSVTVLRGRVEGF
jgi:hypothetical protein